MLPLPRFGMLAMQAPPWRGLSAGWREYDALGFDHGWLCDHFVGNDGELRYKAWTLLGALALALAPDRIRLGVSVTCITVHHPALLAFVGRYRDAGVADFVFDEPRPDQRLVFERVATEDLPTPPPRYAGMIGVSATSPSRRST